jgi:hypothetical protein
MVSDPMSNHESQDSVQMLMNDCLATGQSMAPVAALDLHDQVVNAHGVVPTDGTFVALREHHFQVPVPAGYERRSALRCRNGEAPVELGDVMLIEKLGGPSRAQIPRNLSSCDNRPAR